MLRRLLMALTIDERWLNLFADKDLLVSEADVRHKAWVSAQAFMLVGVLVVFSTVARWRNVAGYP